MAMEQATEGQVPVKPRRSIGPIGTVARLATAVGLGVMVASAGVGWYEAVLSFVGLPAVVMLIVIVSRRLLRTSAYLNATGPWGTLANLAMIVALFAVLPQVAAIFYGVPMLLAAWRGYPGCEMLAISNFVLRRGDESLRHRPRYSNIASS